MNARTYSLAEVAAAYLPPEWNGVLWLSRRLNRGEISGYRVGRIWRMTDDDVAAFVAKYHHPTKTTGDAAASIPAAPPVSILDGLSARSRQTVRSA